MLFISSYFEAYEIINMRNVTPRIYNIVIVYIAQDLSLMQCIKIPHSVSVDCVPIIMKYNST